MKMGHADEDNLQTVTCSSLSYWFYILFTLTTVFIVLFTTRSKVKARFLVLLAGAFLIGSIYIYGEQKCQGIPNHENGNWPDIENTLQRHYQAYGKDKYEKLADLVEKYGFSKIENLFKNINESSTMPTIPFFAKTVFQWNTLGHFNKSDFLEQEIENCKNLKDKVQEFEEQQQKSGISKEAALKKYAGKLPKWEISEIENLWDDEIWFLGLGSNKTIRIPENVTNNFGFDHPKESPNKGRYKWVVGDHLNYRYEINKYLGGGTYGEVLEAIDHKYNSHVAVKVLNNYTSISKHIMTEYYVVNRINMHFPNSPYFIRNIDNFKFRNHFCMVFELLGDSAYELYDAVNFRKNEDLLRDYVSEILKGLVLLHSTGILHNDMKPDNLLLETSIPGSKKRRMIKIMDFGLSCVANSKNMKCPEYYIQTRYYRSPEVILAIPYSQASDMWSLGVIVGEMFRGTEFIFGESEPDQLAAIMENIGLPPVSMLEISERKHIYYQAVCYVTEKGFHRRPYRKSITKTLQLNSPEHDLLLDFLTRLLQWDPNKRMTAEDALNHPWLTGKLSDYALLPPLDIHL